MLSQRARSSLLALMCRLYLLLLVTRRRRQLEQPEQLVQRQPQAPPPLLELLVLPLRQELPRPLLVPPLLLVRPRLRLLRQLQMPLLHQLRTLPLHPLAKHGRIVAMQALICLPAQLRLAMLFTRSAGSSICPSPSRCGCLPCAPAVRLRVRA